ncbi:MAG: radical SAM protein [Eubacteriales bacterium]|nr:radical SAM protein [Eubacteriales bacterium]
MHFVDAKGILSAQNGMNLYRGCTHGCIYCDSRSACYQFTHAFEDVEVKRNAPQLLEEALLRRRSRCMIGTGAMCDPYLPCEEELLLTRRCLEVIERHGFGLAIQTKSDRILRDLDLLRAINARAKCVVQMTLTTFDEELCRVIEPNVCTTRRRFETLCILREHDIPTVVWLCPLLPWINDTEENLRGILDYCFHAGVRGVIQFGIGLTLREGSREYFYAALERHFPGLKQKYARKHGLSYELLSDQHERLMQIFHAECESHGVLHDNDALFAYLHEFPRKNEGEQLSFL